MRRRRNALSRRQMRGWRRRTATWGKEDVRTYVMMWQWLHSEQRQGLKPADVFSDARVHASTIKASASELLTLYPLLRFYVATVLSRCEAMQLSIDSFSRPVQLDRCIGAVQEGRRYNWCGSAHVGHSLHDGIRACLREPACRPKHMFLFHLGDQIERDGVYLDCWVHERKHQIVKATCNWTDHTVQLEASALSRTLAEQERQLSRMRLDDHLCEPIHPCLEALAPLQAREACVSKCLWYKRSADMDRELPLH